SLPALCADAPSLSNMVCEIGRAYEACLQGGDLSGGPIQYADLAEWQNELLESEATEAGRSYWRKQDHSSLSTIRLPYEKYHSKEPWFDPAVYTLKITRPLASQIESLTGEARVAIAELLFACWYILLWRLQGQSDIIAGLASNHRKYKELEGALGQLGQYLPFYCHLEDGLGFSEALRRIAEAWREVDEWEEYFSWAQLSRTRGSLEERAFFPVSFEFFDQSARHSVAGLSFSIYRIYACIDRFKIKLTCKRTADSLIAEFHYDKNLFSPEALERIGDQYHTLLLDATNRPEAAIGELKILGERERQQILAEFSRTDADYSADACLHKLFEDQVARTPDKTAALCDRERVSYGKLNARANQIARYLRREGVSAGSLVGICANRSIDMIAGMLAILKAGGAYVPLDPALPKARLAFILKDAQVSALLVQRGVSDSIPDCDARMICLDSDNDRIAQESEENLEEYAAGESLAYVIYTSGSTGWPKGVMISHRAICNRVLWGQSVYPLSDSDRVLQSAASGFDFSVWEIFAPLAAGASVILPGVEGTGDTSYLIKLISEQQVTVAHFVPSLFEIFLGEKEVGVCRSLKLVFSGGEALPVALKEKFFEKVEGKLYNQYGPTEAAVDATCYFCERGVWQATVPIGRPIGRIQTYILDRHLQPVPIGVPGELHIGGVGLAQGYLRRPDLTAERFIPNPFSDQPGGRLYKSGDLARYLPDGNIEFLGRIDQQVKLRGMRIELGEIESLLSQHPAVSRTVAMVREDMPGDKRLVAYVVPNHERAPGPGELQGFLRERVPEFMVPQAIVTMSALPLLPSGKVDRQSLPAPDQGRSGQAEAYVAPSTEIEEALARIWGQVLGLEQVGVRDNFFELGGHSLTAMQLISRVRGAFHLELPLRCLFEHPTVEQLGEVVEAMLIEKVEELSEEEAQRLLELNRV
ncbi:MAG TPA: amino acid adenylation domain-containing protein, partial [Blastocatellia bacterium]|nr:amino acid adenylation domain-containing protein [Blastocatellia bacterium]